MELIGDTVTVTPRPISSTAHFVFCASLHGDQVTRPPPRKAKVIADRAHAQQNDVCRACTCWWIWCFVWCVQHGLAGQDHQLYKVLSLCALCSPVREQRGGSCYVTMSQFFIASRFHTKSGFGLRYGTVNVQSVGAPRRVGFAVCAELPPLSTRILLLCLTYLNDWTHACFQKGKRL